jgi:predicted metal-dependent phosphoesterase TrpH
VFVLEELVKLWSHPGRNQGIYIGMKFKIDLHVHTKYSGDNDSDPEESVLRAIELGLHGIAFTDHYYYAASEPVEILKAKFKNSILILRGVEFSTAEGHCLIFGVDTDTLSLKYASVNEVIQVVQQKGGVVIPSHPFRSVNSLGDLVRNVPGLCALEGYNGCNMHAFNMKAIEAAEALNLPYTGGSDAHTPREVGSCFTEFDYMVTDENLIDVLKAGKFQGVDNRKISKVMIQRF